MSKKYVKMLVFDDDFERNETFYDIFVTFYVFYVFFLDYSSRADHIFLLFICFVNSLLLFLQLNRLVLNYLFLMLQA